MGGSCGRSIHTYCSDGGLERAHVLISTLHQTHHNRYRDEISLYSLLSWIPEYMVGSNQAYNVPPNSPSHPIPTHHAPPKPPHIPSDQRHLNAPRSRPLGTSHHPPSYTLYQHAAMPLEPWYRGPKQRGRSAHVAHSITDICAARPLGGMIRSLSLFCLADTLWR